MTFFILVPLGLLLAFLGRAACVVVVGLGVFLVYYVLYLLADQTGHPGLFWLCLIGGGIGLAVAYDQHTKWRVRQFMRSARTKLILKQDPTGWELYDPNQPLLPVHRGHVPHDKIWLCKQNPQSPEARRLMEPSPSGWAFAVQKVEKEKCAAALCARIPPGDVPIFMASEEFRKQVSAAERPYIEMERHFQKQPLYPPGAWRKIKPRLLFAAAWFAVIWGFIPLVRLLGYG